MYFGETNIIKTKKKLPEGPNKLPKNKITINLTYCRYKILREICKELNWNYF